MKRHWNRKGFTLAEVLIVVAIIVVLAGVGFVALFSHMRSMHQLEMDGQAKELFVAAQNHLALAESQGYLGVESTAFGTKEEVGPGATDYGIYYFSVGSDGEDDPNDTDSILNQMLPFASVDESARTGGCYIIRYQKSPATILDVFYVSTSGRYSLKPDDEGVFTYSEVMKYRDDKDHDRKKDRRDKFNGGDTVLGYYGGETALNTPKGEPLVPPAVQIVNAETLYVSVTDYNKADDGHAVNLIVTGNTSHAEASFPVTPGASGEVILLDEVTGASNTHFVNKLSSFAPGENITVKAIAYNNTVLTNIAQSGTQETNSLFASYDGTNTVEIANIRHLLNLHGDVSNVGAKNTDNKSVVVKKAVQTADLLWDDPNKDDDGGFVEKTGGSISNLTGNVTTASYLPVEPKKAANSYALEEYDGGSHKITGVMVNISGDAGLFASLTSCSVHDLELVDFNITGTGNAGALVGTASNSTITGVLVHNDTANGKNDSALVITGVNAGGLVGSMTSGSVQASAAAVYVKAVTGDAGGLIGTAGTSETTVTVDSSYAGGHTQGAKYLTTDGDGVAARVNVIGGASAGGLIGSATGTSISNSYTTASVKGATPGGFIGTRSGGAIDNVYASGLVISSAADGKPYPFIGNGGSEQTGITSASYLLGVTTVVMNDQHDVTGITPVSSGVTGTAFSPATKASAVVYDTTLGVQYAFKTIDQLRGSSGVGKPGITDRHYGDWQLPSLTDLNYVLKNNDPVTTTTLYTEIKLESTTQLVTLAVQGETSKNVRLFVLNVTRGADGKVTAVTVKSESGVDTADSSKNWQKTSGCTALPISFTTGSTTPTVTVTLDSITAANGHFAQLFASGSEAKLIPGENVTLYVRGGEGVWDEVKNLGREETEAEAGEFGDFNPYAKVDNSLFAFAFTKAKGGTYVNGTTLADAINHDSVTDAPPTQIANFRHLQNLDYTVSNVVDGVKKVQLQKDLNWNNEKSGYTKDGHVTITSISNKTVTDSFCGIYTKALTEFDGNNKTISNLVVDGSKMDSDFTDKGLYSAGLFRYVESGLTVKNLHLVKPIITAGGDATTIGNAGAVAGEVVSTASLTIDTVLAEPGGPETGETAIPAAQMTVSASVGAAGGLVGLGKGAISINNSAAVLLVNGGTAAGGLVGSSEASVTLTASYVGGHTEGGQYSKTNWNITSTGAAGGLIGKMAGSATITDSFTTASVSADAGKAGGLVGVSTGSFTALNYAYTVAPVSGVLSQGSDGSNGALIGSTASDIANGEMFFLSDVYEDLPNVTEIGTTGKKFTNESKVHVADIFNKTDPTIMGLTVSGGVTDISKLETHTTTYDSTLTAEYPFKIWTTFGDDGRHFYGDWVPPVNSESTQFEIHFLIQTPGSNPVDFVMDTGSGVPVSSTTVYAQMEPFTGAQVTVPTMPYKPGYNYGSSDGIVSLSYTNSDPLANTATACVWQVYIGDQTTALKGGAMGVNLGARYSRNGGAINLSEEDLCAALPEGAASGHLTLVAYYYQLKNQYSFTLMDYNPASVNGVPSTEDGYVQWGGMQYVNQPGFNGTEDGITLCYKHVYKYEGNNAFDAAYGNLIIPRLNVTGYTFLGWFDGPENTASPVFSCTNGVLKLETPNEEIDGNVKLYAHYRKNEEATIKLAFVLLQGGKEVPLSAEFDLKFDKSLGFDQNIDLPGYNSPSGVTGVKVVKTTGTQNATILDLSSGGSPASSTEVWFNRLKVKTTDDDGHEVEVDGATDRSVHIRTGVLDSYADKYTIYYQGNVETVGVVVMHELDHTSYTSATATYSYGTATYYEQVAELLILQGDQLKISDHPEWYPDNPLGKTTLRDFEKPRLEEIFVYPYSTENAAKYGVASPTTSTGKNIAYIVVVPYERSKYELRFVNLGMSQSDPKFQWKMLYAGETITLPQTSATSPQLYGGNYTFKGWQYEYEDGSLITQIPTVMPDHNLVLRAQYEGQPVDYTVLVWVENPDPDKNADGTPKTNPDGSLKYSYTQVGRKVITGGAYPGETINVSLANGEVNVGTARIAPTAIGIAGIVDKTVGDETVRLSPYIEYSHSDDNVTADGKGTTKFNVYYDRKVYRIRFDVGFSEPTGTASYQPITEYVDGDVYGLVGSSYRELIKNGDNQWLYEDPNGGYYGWDAASGQYVLLTSQPNTVPYYKAEYRYTPTTNNDPEQQFGIVSISGENYYVPLTRQGKTEYTYALLNAARTVNGSYYGIQNDEYKPLTYDGATEYPASTYYTRDDGTQVTYTNQQRYVLATNNNGTQYGISNNQLVELVRTKRSSNGNHWFVKDNLTDLTRYDDLPRYKKDNNGTWVFDSTDGKMYELTTSAGYWIFTWTLDGAVYGQTKSNDANLGQGDTNLDNNSFFTRGSTTTYTWYNGEAPYADARYTRANNTYNDEYTREQLVERDGVLYYKDTNGRYGAQNAYVSAVWKRDAQQTTYYLNSVEYTGTVYRFSEYSNQLYQLQQAHKYYISTISSKNNYNDYLTTRDNANSAGNNTTKPFTYRTAKSFAKDSYNGTRKESKNGTEYTIYYWDIVAKYGSNIKEMWPTTFSNQSNKGFIGWVINPSANDSSGSIKDAREILNEKLFVGAGIAQTKNADGIYVGEPSHVLKGRYASVGRHFVSRYYFKDPDTGEYPAEPKYEYVYNSQAGNPAEQKVGDVDGYAQQDYDLLNSNGTVRSPKTWSAYSVKLMLTPNTTVNDAMIFKYYFDPIPYDINFEYVGDLTGAITGLGTNGVVNNVPFGKHIGKSETGTVSYAYTEIPGLNINEYSWDGNWYDNEACIGDPFFKAGDTEYNKTRTMPNGELTLYAKVIHKPVTVTLNLGTVETGETVRMNNSSSSYVNSAWPWQEPVSDLLLADSGGFKAEFTPVRTAPEDADYVWKFVGWSTKQNGTKDDEYVYAQPQLTALNLYPIWEQEEEPKAAKVYITYQYYDEDTNSYVNFADANLPESAATTVTVHPNNPTAQIKVGDYFSMTAPEIPGYTAVTASFGPVLVNAEEFKDQVVFKYRKTSWDITVEYYVQFTSVEPEKWLGDDTDEVITSGTSKGTKIEGATRIERANSEYYLMGYKAPTGTGLGWLNGYRFDHYVYDGEPCYSEYVTVHPDAATNRATVKVYLTPDTDAIEIPDLVEPYIGESYANYSAGNPFEGTPSSVGVCEIHYVYYDANGKKLDDDQVVNAGAYGVRAYITVDAQIEDEDGNTSTGTFLLWQSIGATPPLHLYIQRRVVILYSAIAEKTEDGSVLQDPTVFYRPFTSAMAASSNEAKAKIARYYDPNDEAHYLGLQDYVNAAGPGNAGFVKSHGNNFYDDVYFEWEFSASSFRLEKGTSLNIFTYKVTDAGKALGMENNYYFYVCFGTLTVK